MSTTPRPARLLVIEENPTTLRALCASLHGRDFCVWPASSVSEARSLLAASPDAVVLDASLESSFACEIAALDLPKPTLVPPSFERANREVVTQFRSEIRLKVERRRASTRP
jgi:hypothetical protein